LDGQASYANRNAAPTFMLRTHSLAGANAVASGVNFLNGVACPGVSACTAVGVYRGPTGSPGNEGLLLTGSEASWSAGEAPVPGNAAMDPEPSLGSVACASASACVAAGSYTTVSGNTRPLLVLGAGSSWSAIQAPSPRNAGASPPNYQLPSVACAKKASACVAVGSYPDVSGDDQALLLTGPP
jgi:hypothetical protein